MTTPAPQQSYPGIQITMKPGGLSSGAHAVNVILSLLSLGLWLPVYGVAALGAPIKRVDVTAPAGTPADAIEAARRQALALTPEEQVTAHRKRIGLAILLPLLILGPCVLCIAATRH